ncbi:MAG: hypothetical protein IAE91_14640, partial [Ignavibacteriaceae bacterium]|nr:hypothetical protein [Ignavibacteriaceae bacterium]
ESGEYEVEFRDKKEEGNDLVSGIYFYRIEVRQGSSIPVYSQTGKMVFLK